MLSILLLCNFVSLCVPSAAAVLEEKRLVENAGGDADEESSR